MIDVGIADDALGLERSGDRAVVAESGGGTLLAAIDGLGHGELAAEAADAAEAVLRDAVDAPLSELFRRCHDALERTRGVVMTVARIHHAGGRMEWAGIGNVEARLIRPAQWGIRAESPLLLGGILGARSRLMRKPRTSVTQVSPGDVVVMATDGVRADFSTDLPLVGSAQAIAESIMARSGRGNDDALVLVVRWLGPAG